MKIRRFKKVLVSVVVAFVTLLVLLVGILSVTSIPIKPILAVFGVTPELFGRKISFEALQLDFAGGFRIRAQNIKIPGTGDLPLLEVRESEALIGPAAIFRWSLFPSEILVRGISCTLERTNSGVYFETNELFKVRDPTEPSQTVEGKSSVKLIEFINSLHDAGAKNSAFKILRRVRLEDLDLTFVDHTTNSTWKTNDVELLLQHSENGLLQTTMSSRLVRNGEKISSILTVSHQAGAKEVLFSANFKLPTLTLLDGYVASHLSEVWSGEVGLRVEGALDDDGIRENVLFRLDAANGSVRQPKAFPGDLPLRSIQIDGNYAPAQEGTLTIEKFEIEDDRKLKVIGSAKLSHLSGKTLGEISVAMNPGSIDQLSRYFPHSATPSLSAWLATNLHKAELSNVTVRVNGPIREFPFTSDQTDRSFDASFSFKGLEVKFLKNVPAGENLSGTFQIKNSRLEIRAESGTVGTQQVKNIGVVIEDLYSKPVLSADGKIYGEAKELRQLLTPLIPAIAQLKIHNGQHNSRFSLLVPLSDNPNNLGPALSAEGDLMGVVASYGSNPQKLSEVKARFSASLQNLSITGTGRFERDLVEFSAKDGAPWMQKKIEVSVNGALPVSMIQPALEEKGIISSGSAKVSLLVNYAPSAGIRLKTVIDLGNAELSIPQLTWSKKLQEPASISAEGIWNPKSGEWNVSKLSAVGKDLTIRGSLRALLPESRLLALSLSPIVLLKNRLTLQYANGSWSIAGSNLEITGSGDKSRSTTDLPDKLAMKVELGRLVLGKEVLLNTRGVIEIDQGTIKKFNVAFKAPSGAANRADVSLEGNEPVLRVSSDDAGQVFRLLGLGSLIRGGKLSGKIRPGYSGKFDVSRFEGELSLNDAEIVDSKLLLDLVSFLSIKNLLTQRGRVPFSLIRFRFRHAAPKFELLEAQAAGPVIAIYLKGSIDEESSTIQAQGEAVPFAVLGSVAEFIPIIGNVFSRVQKNFIAAHYEVSGSLSNPRISPSFISSIPESFRKSFLPIFGGKE